MNIIFQVSVFHRRLKAYLADTNSVFFHHLPAQTSKSHDRVSFIKAITARKRVLHFGFTDAPFTAERVSSGELLHSQLRQSCEFLYGLDIDQASIEQYREATQDINNSALDIQAPLPDADFLKSEYDVIIFGEVLEHLINPGLALTNLLQICKNNPSAKLVITVPNAYFIGAFFVAMDGNENVHPDHYYYFSPVTLRKLISDSGFSQIDISLYGSSATHDAPGITKNGVIAVCRP